ncbi:MAG: metallophosphoesterase, partial [Terriglobales bacterium]
QRPHLIVVTGDFVTQSPAFIEPVSELLEKLRAPLGVFAVLGNHDFRAGADVLTRALRRRHLTVLRNQHRLVHYGGAEFKIAGIDDSRQHPDVGRAVGSCARRFTLLLAHNPMALSEAAACGVDLVLSGHTHGGQIKFNFAAPLYQRFLPAGLLSLDGTQMYISRGLGKVIVPMRVGAPPELAFLRLHPGR